jgi:hypothetical protein
MSASDDMRVRCISGEKLSKPISMEPTSSKTSCDQFHKLFVIIFIRYQHIAVSFDSGYAARGINYAKKFY